MLTDNEKRRQSKKYKKMKKGRESNCSGNFLISMYTVLQIYNVCGEGYFHLCRRGNLRHWPIFNQLSVMSVVWLFPFLPGV